MLLSTSLIIKFKQLGIVISVHPVDFNSFLAFSGQKPVETVDFNSFLTSTKATRFVTSKMCLVVKMTSFTNKFFCSIIFMACWPVRKKPQLFRMLQFRDGNERPSFIRKCTFGQTLIKKNYVLQFGSFFVEMRTLICSFKWNQRETRHSALNVHFWQNC